MNTANISTNLASQPPPTGSSVRPAASAGVVLALMLIILAMTAGCTSGHAVKRSSAGHVPPVTNYLIGPADVLSINVWNHKEMNRTVTVRPDGKLSYSLLGDIPAAGLQPVELQANIEEGLSSYMQIVPGEVTVVVDAVHSYTVSVLGEVRLPGRFEFRNQVSIMDALAMAGGLTEFASGSKIQIFRVYRGHNEKIRFDYGKLVNSKHSAVPPPLFPGDVIFVP